MASDQHPVSDFRESSHEQPTKIRWVVFVLCCGTSMMLYLHRYTFALIKPKLKAEWQLSNTELGWMDTAFSMCYMAFQVPSGILADVAGTHVFLGVLILVWTGGLALHALAPNVPTMVAARAVLGIGQAGTYPTLSRITRNWFPAPSRTSVQGWVAVFCGRIGAASSNLLFGAALIGILFSDDWRRALLVLVAMGVALAVAHLSLYRDTPREHSWANDAEAELIEGTTSKDPEKRMPMAEMFQGMRPKSVVNLLMLNTQSILSTVADAVYSLWIPTFLVEVHKMQFKEMGIYASLPLLGGALGGASAGMLNDWMIRRTGNRRWSRSGVAFVGKGMAGVLLLSALYFYDDPYRFCAMLFFVKFFGDWSLTTSWGTVTDIGGRATATVFAFNNCIAALIGGLVSPFYGYYADSFGWYPVFVLVAFTYIYCAVSWLLVDCTIPLMRDDAKDNS